MQHKQRISEELQRMKNLFGYQKGRVISEQITDKQREAMNAGWGPVTDAYAQTLPVDKLGKIIKKEIPQNTTSNPTQSLKQMDDSYVNDKSWKGKKLDKKHGLRQCHSNYKGPCDVIWDGHILNYMPENLWTKKFGMKVPETVEGKDNLPKGTTLPPVDVRSTPSLLKKPVGNKTGIQAFQDWLDQNRSGWLKEYGTLDGKPQRGYGKFGPNTSKAWGLYKDEYLKSLPKQEVEIKKIQVEPVKPPTELKIPTNLPTLQPKQNVQVNKDEEVTFGDEEEGSFGD